MYFWFFLKYHHRQDQILQLFCASGTNNKEGKGNFIKVEVTLIDIVDISGDGMLQSLFLITYEWDKIHNDSLRVM